MFVHFFFIFITSLLITDCVFAAETEKQAKIILFASSMPGQTDTDISSGRAGAEINAEMNHLFNDDFSFRLQPWYQYDSLNRSKDEKSQLELLEANFK